MAKTKTHPWTFRARFRRNAFGWKSRPAIERIREAVSEIRKVARTDPRVAAEGAVLFLEKLVPAIEHVDGSSGSIGNAVHHAIEAIVPIIAGAPADTRTRDAWLERLFQAYQDDGYGYLDTPGDHWGELCASAELASTWADRLLEGCRLAQSPEPELRGYFKGTTNCLSALLAAGRHRELLELRELAPRSIWQERQYGARALAAMGRTEEAIRYAEDGRDLLDSHSGVARFCEEILLSVGRIEDAYRRYALLANRAGTYLARFRAVCTKYPHKKEAEILMDLVAATPGEEGKWFAAAKDAGLFDEAIALAERSPCAPQTLTRAARDFARKKPAFAFAAGMAALRWLVEGHGYEITALDVHDAFSSTVEAARNAGCTDEARERIRALVASHESRGSLVSEVLERALGT